MRFFICYHLLSVIIDQLKFICSLKELRFKLSYLAKEKKLWGTGFGKKLCKLVLHENHVLELMHLLAITAVEFVQNLHLA